MCEGRISVKWKIAEEKFVLSLKRHVIYTHRHFKVRAYNVLRHALHKIQSPATYSGRSAGGEHIRLCKAGWGPTSA
jgi:hypothetical protein